MKSNVNADFTALMPVSKPLLINIYDISTPFCTFSCSQPSVNKEETVKAVKKTAFSCQTVLDNPFLQLSHRFGTLGLQGPRVENKPHCQTALFVTFGVNLLNPLTNLNHPERFLGELLCNSGKANRPRTDDTFFYTFSPHPAVRCGLKGAFDVVPPCGVALKEPGRLYSTVRLTQERL